MATSSEFVRGVDFVGVPTRDMPALATFCDETLGLPRSVYQPEREYAEFEAGNLTLSLYNPEALGFEHHPAENAIALHVDDVAATRQKLEARGVEFRGEIFDSGVCRMTLFADPEGNVLMLHHCDAPRVTER
jgi:predicted enzyme related to lactoylglutathione lyase